MRRERWDDESRRRRVVVTHEEWDDQTGLPSRGDDGEPQDEVKEREQMVTPAGKETLKAEFGRSSAPGADS